MEKKDTLIKLKLKERQLRRQIIIDAAREVFGKKTYDRVSMAEIARTAGIAKSSIYTYFKNQEELYTRIVCQDAETFISLLRYRIQGRGRESLAVVIPCFLDYYIQRMAQWRMITHLALHGTSDAGAVEELNPVGRNLMDVLEQVFIEMGCTGQTRIMAHSLFASLSGILIAYRNYPGQSEARRIAHMHRIGTQVLEMMTATLITGRDSTRNASVSIEER